MHHLSVLDTRTKQWRECRDKWQINSHLGREETISNSSTWNNNEVSIFDPLLAELFYTWYLPKGGKIIDPFAGGSVRGIVAHELGYDYTGIDLSEQQIRANKKQSTDIKWIQGDSEQVLDELENDYDFVFTCPPYHDLEKYTQHPDDLSQMEWNEFTQKYRSIISKTAERLKDNRFFAIVVSEIRWYTPGVYTEGEYKNFVGLTIDAATSAGLKYYNDYVVINPFQRAALVSNRYYNKNRKVPRVHQNVLVFVKGNPDIATIDLNGLTEPVCWIDDIPYRSWSEAAIAVGINSQRVKDRCENPRPRWNGYKKGPNS